MEINPNDSEEDKRRHNQESSVDHAVVVNPVLAEPTDKDETTEGTNINEVQSPMALNRKDIVFQKRTTNGQVIEAIDFLTQSTRKGTYRAYDHG